MVIQIIIGLIFLIIVFYLLRLDHHAKKIKLILIMALGLVIYFSIMGIFSSSQVDLSSPKGIVSAVYVYFGWIGQTASNLWDIGVETTHMVGNAIKINNTDSKR